MRSGQYNNRKPKNAVGAGKRASGNEFNTSLKRERHPEPPQYPTSKVDERKQFSESRDARPKESGNRSQSSSSDSSSSRSNSSSSKSSRSSTNNMKQMQSAARTVVQNTVVMVAGTTTVLANTVMPELKTTISETFHIDLPTIAVVEEQSGESATDWLVEGDEPGIFEEDASDESPEDATDVDGDADSDSGDSDSGDGDDSGDSSADSDSPDAEPQDTAEQEPPAEPEEPEQPEELKEEEKPEEEKPEEEKPEEEKPEEEKPEEPKEEEVPQVPEQPEQTETPIQTEDGGGDDSGGGGGDAPSEPSWTWNADNSSAEIQVQGVHSDDVVVTKTEDPATCTEDGSITYTATATVGGQTYTDTRVEKIEATGHHFEAPVKMSDGRLSYHCDDCNRNFIIEFNITEEQ